MLSKFLDKEGLEVLWSIVKENDLRIEGEMKKVVNLGYFYENEFYVDQAHIQKYVPYSYKIFIDIPTHTIYAYMNNAYIAVGRMPGQATPTRAGIVKLYNEKGTNLDGSVTQNLFTDITNEKVGAVIDEDTLILTH